MAPVNKGSASIDILSVPKISGGVIAEGAIVYLTDYDTVVVAGGAGAVGLLGVAKNAATGSGQSVSVQVLGQANVLIAASETVTLNDRIISANSSGHGKSIASTTNCDVIGRVMRTQTVAAGAAELVPVMLGLQYEDA